MAISSPVRRTPSAAKSSGPIAFCPPSPRVTLRSAVRRPRPRESRTRTPFISSSGWAVTRRTRPETPTLRRARATPLAPRSKSRGWRGGSASARGTRRRRARTAAAALGRGAIPDSRWQNGPMKPFGQYPDEKEPPKAVVALLEQVDRDGGRVLAVYREPVGGNWQAFCLLPLEKVAPTPYQRDLSPTHAKRLHVVAIKIGRFAA